MKVYVLIKEELDYTEYESVFSSRDKLELYMRKNYPDAEKDIEGDFFENIFHKIGSYKRYWLIHEELVDEDVPKGLNDGD